MNEGKAEEFQHKLKPASAKAHVVKRSASLDVLCDLSVLCSGNNQAVVLTSVIKYPNHGRPVLPRGRLDWDTPRDMRYRPRVDHLIQLA
jgi:hypothetical protein